MATLAPFFDGLLIKNTFFDVDDLAPEVDPRRSASSPPACRHGAFALQLEAGSMCHADSTGSSESTVTPRGRKGSKNSSASQQASVTDSTSDDGECQSPSFKSPQVDEIASDDGAASNASQQGSDNDIASDEGECQPPWSKSPQRLVDDIASDDGAASNASQQGSVNDIASDEGECQPPWSKSPQRLVDDIASDDGAASNASQQGSVNDIASDDEGQPPWFKSPQRWVDDIASDDEECVSPSFKFALNARALEWSPTQQTRAMIPGSLGVLTATPTLFRDQFFELFKAAESTLSWSSLVKSVRLFQGPGLWGVGVKIVGTMSPEDIGWGKDEVLALVQNCLLRGAEESQNTYVLGYAVRPFHRTEHGCGAMFAGMLNSGCACQDILARGFCQQGGLCSMRHPACIVPLYIDIQAESLEESQ